MESNNSVCPLKWFNTRLIGFWSFTNRFSESKFSVGSVHTANSFTHHHSLIARPNNDPKLRFWVTLEGEREEEGEEREWETGAMCFTIQFNALCLAPKWQNTLEKVMPVQQAQCTNELGFTVQYSYACKWLSNSISVPFVENCLTRNATATTKQQHQFRTHIIK